MTIPESEYLDKFKKCNQIFDDLIPKVREVLANEIGSKTQLENLFLTSMLSQYFLASLIRQASEVKPTSEEYILSVLNIVIEQAKESAYLDHLLNNKHEGQELDVIYRTIIKPSDAFLNKLLKYSKGSTIDGTH